MFNKFRMWIAEKANPTQDEVYLREQSAVTETNITFQTAYEKVEILSRGVDMLVDQSASITFDINNALDFFSSPSRIRQKLLEKRLNGRPNPFIDRNFFYRTLYMDLVLTGNAFLYFDGEYLYNIPSSDMEIVSHPKRRIEKYVYGNQSYQTDEIIHIADNSSKSYLKGDSRLKSAELSAKTLYSMINLQKEYVDNGLSLGDVLLNDDMLGRNQKKRYLAELSRTVGRGRKRPAFLDGGTKLDRGTARLKEELDFDTSIKGHEDRILHALGVPSVLIKGGNNANIMPNMKLFYLTTILPMCEKLESALEAYFGYDIKINKADIVALQPEMKELASYLTTMVNNGLLTVNEARLKLRRTKYSDEQDPDADIPRDPQNITGGSTVRPETGGRPEEEDNNE